MYNYVYVLLIDYQFSSGVSELMAELNLMKLIKPHQHICNLIAQCTTPGKIIHVLN